MSSNSSKGRTGLRTHHRILQRLAGVLLVVVAVGSAARAVAEDVAVSLRGEPTVVLTTPRDPKLFMEDMTVVLPRPVVPLTMQDALTQELLRRNRTMTETEALRTASALCDEAKRMGYDPFLFLAVIRIESNYNHLAISPVGAEGLMQLMPPTAEWMAERHRIDWDQQHSFDPVTNVRLGSRYLVELHKEMGRMDYALTAYNRGPRATWYIVGRHGGLPPEIHEFYSEKVLEKYRMFKAMYGHLPMG